MLHEIISVRANSLSLSSTLIIFSPPLRQNHHYLAALCWFSALFLMCLIVVGTRTLSNIQKALCFQPAVRFWKLFPEAVFLQQTFSGRQAVLGWPGAWCTRLGAWIALEPRCQVSAAGWLGARRKLNLSCLFRFVPLINHSKNLSRESLKSSL